jgi:hypothetical protein
MKNAPISLKPFDGSCIYNYNINYGLMFIIFSVNLFYLRFIIMCSDLYRIFFETNFKHRFFKFNV